MTLLARLRPRTGDDSAVTDADDPVAAAAATVVQTRHDLDVVSDELRSHKYDVADAETAATAATVAVDAATAAGQDLATVRDLQRAADDAALNVRLIRNRLAGIQQRQTEARNRWEQAVRRHTTLARSRFVTDLEPLLEQLRDVHAAVGTLVTDHGDAAATQPVWTSTPLPPLSALASLVSYLDSDEWAAMVDTIHTQAATTAAHGTGA